MKEFLSVKVCDGVWKVVVFLDVPCSVVVEIEVSVDAVSGKVLEVFVSVVVGSKVCEVVLSVLVCCVVVEAVSVLICGRVGEVVFSVVVCCEVVEISVSVVIV